jgi:hypothetical protein
MKISRTCNWLNIPTYHIKILLCVIIFLLANWYGISYRFLFTWKYWPLPINALKSERIKVILNSILAGYFLFHGAQHISIKWTVLCDVDSFKLSHLMFGCWRDSEFMDFLELLDIRESYFNLHSIFIMGRGPIWSSTNWHLLPGDSTVILIPSIKVMHGDSSDKLVILCRICPWNWDVWIVPQ